MWFTENPWPPVIILALIACGMVAAWSSQKRAAWLAGAVVLLIGCVGIFVLEEAIVTEGERVEANVRDLAWSFQKKDRDKVLGFFSPQAADLRGVIKEALDSVDVKDDLDIKDMEVRVYGGGAQALSHFRANATVSWKGLNVGHQPSRWELTWQKEGDDWKILDVQRLNPIKNEKMRVFEQSPQ